jgi:hypothetical protein
MALFEKKESGKPEKSPPPKPTEVSPPKDTSGFGGKPYVTRQEGMFWAKREGFRKTGLQPEEVLKHWDEITKDAPSGYVTKSWAEQKLIKLQQQFSSMTASTDWVKRRDMMREIKVLKGFLGKE